MQREAETTTMADQVTTYTGPSGGMVAIGVLSIIGGLFTLAAAPFGAIMAPLSDAITGHRYAAVRLPVDIAMAVALIATGIGTILRWRWARPLAIVYAWGRIALAGVGAAVTYTSIDALAGAAPAFSGAVRVSLIVGPLFAVAYPVTLLVFYTRPGVIRLFH